MNQNYECRQKYAIPTDNLMHASHGVINHIFENTERLQLKIRQRDGNITINELANSVDILHEGEKVARVEKGDRSGVFMITTYGNGNIQESLASYTGEMGFNIFNKELYQALREDGGWVKGLLGRNRVYGKPIKLQGSVSREPVFPNIKNLALRKEGWFRDLPRPKGHSE